MKLSKYEVGAFVIFLASLVAAIIVYPHLPAQMASHWGSNGEVNGYMSSFWGAFLMPIVIAVMLVIFIIIPRVDPKKENIEKMKPLFGRFIILIMLFMGYVYALTLWWNFGGRFSMIQYFAPAFAVLFYYVGVMVGGAQQNFSIGIRTPWTLSNEVVWQKTHKLGGKLFRLSGIIALFGWLWPNLAIWFVLVPIMAFMVFTVIYSYVMYRRETAKVK